MARWSISSSQAAAEAAEDTLVAVEQEDFVPAFLLQAL
jgi:hypothetical protein